MSLTVHCFSRQFTVKKRTKKILQSNSSLKIKRSTLDCSLRMFRTKDFKIWSRSRISSLQAILKWPAILAVHDQLYTKWVFHQTIPSSSIISKESSPMNTGTIMLRYHRLDKNWMLNLKIRSQLCKRSTLKPSKSHWSWVDLKRKTYKIKNRSEQKPIVKKTWKSSETSLSQECLPCLAR